MKIRNGWLDAALDGHYGAKSSSREGHKPKYLVMHGTAGGTSATATDDWFTNGKDANGNPIQASSHFIIDQQGIIVQGVSCDVAAWANCCISDTPNKKHAAFLDASINQNLYTISIEHNKAHDDNSDALSPIQAQKSFEVAKVICETYGIPRRAGDADGGIISHADIDVANRSRCPGPYPWDQLYSYLKGTPVNKWLAQAAQDTWNSTEFLFGRMLAYDTGIAKAWQALYLSGKLMPPPTTREWSTFDWQGNPIIVQLFGMLRCEWSNGTAHWYTMG